MLRRANDGPTIETDCFRSKFAVGISIFEIAKIWFPQVD